jgi:hypothetical protein
MNNKLLAALVMLFASYNVFADGYRGAGSTPQDMNKRLDRHYHPHHKNYDKGKRYRRDHNTPKMGGNSRTWAPSDLENRLRQSSGLSLTTANALGRFRRENPDMFKKYFGDVAADNVAQEQDENMVLG